MNKLGRFWRQSMTMISLSMMRSNQRRSPSFLRRLKLPPQATQALKNSSQIRTFLGLNSRWSVFTRQCSRKKTSPAYRSRTNRHGPTASLGHGSRVKSHPCNSQSTTFLNRSCARILQTKKPVQVATTSETIHNSKKVKISLIIVTLPTLDDSK